MTDLTSLTLADARDRLRRREFSAAELADAHLTAQGGGGAVNGLPLGAPGRARAMAPAGGAGPKGGGARPPGGLWPGVKGLFRPKDGPPTAGSRIPDHF